MFVDNVPAIMVFLQEANQSRESVVQKFFHHGAGVTFIALRVGRSSEKTRKRRGRG